MRVNVKTKAPVTHEGGPAVPNTPLLELRRSVLSCLLWEDQFYEDGVDISKRIVALCPEVSVHDLLNLAIEARNHQHLRHVPLLLLLEATKRKTDIKIAPLVPSIIGRADELAEVLAIHWKDGRKPIPAQLKKGLMLALEGFDEYQLAKYDRDGKVKLRDVLRMIRPKPKDEARSALYARLVKRELATPDTWEAALSSGADKKATFERLLKDGKLGYLALLRNLRNMVQANVDTALVRDAILLRQGAHNVLPFRYIAAARAAPQFEPYIDRALLDAIGDQPELPGCTVVLVDVSQSMDAKLSAKSDLRRVDAAAALAAIVKSQSLRVFTFSMGLVEVPPRRGMAGVDAVMNSQPHVGTYLGKALRDLAGKGIRIDRLIIITDEQTADTLPELTVQTYMINVASYQNGVGYGPRLVRISGWSDHVLRYIHELEAPSVVGVKTGYKTKTVAYSDGSTMEARED